MTARFHRIAVVLAPLVVGLLTALIKGLADRAFDPWLLGAAAAGGLLNVYLNYVRSGTDPQVVRAPKVTP